MREQKASSYPVPAIHGALGAVVAARSVDRAIGGFVDIDAVIDDLCEATVTLVAGAGVPKSPAEPRKTADRCRPPISATGPGLARIVVAGEPLKWELAAIP
ncbi:MAG: hypothetical protein M3N02_06775 [Pseudomonadota bacterium]|nr:hypothetical protein [Pseudomonadota bacterium]